MPEPIRIVEAKTDSGSTSTLAFIIGGLVVAVAVIAYFVYGGGTMPGSGGGPAKTSISIENTAPAAPAPTNAAPAPAASAPATTSPAAPPPATSAPAVPAPAAPAPAAPNP